jgi:glycosyltransferase involved in cell wall biosynthesis
MKTLEGRRILAIHPSPDLYGSDRVFVDAVCAMADAGASVETFLPSIGRLGELLADAPVTVHTMSFPVLRKSMLAPRPLTSLALGAWPTIKRLATWIKSVKPDLVFVNTITLPHWLAAARWARVQSICHVHELESQLPRLAASVLLAPLACADRLIVNSEATHRFLKRHLRSASSRAVVVYNGFHMGPVPLPPNFGRPARLVLVGRLNPRKGQDLAIAALAKLRDQGHDVVLELVGDTFAGYEWFEASLRRQAADLGIIDRVIFSGFKPDPSDAYARADIVLVPSRLEPFGNVAVEGLAAGRPVVANAVGGLPEIVRHGVSGLLLPPGDVDAFAVAAAHLLSDPAKAAVMGAEGARDVRSRFGIDRFARELSGAVAVVSGPRTLREPGTQVLSQMRR